LPLASLPHELSGANQVPLCLPAGEAAPRKPAAPAKAPPKKPSAKATAKLKWVFGFQRDP
jgi:hypothetical protein